MQITKPFLKEKATVNAHLKSSHDLRLHMTSVETLNKFRVNGDRHVKLLVLPTVTNNIHDSCPQSLVVMRPLSWTECIFFSVILLPNLFLELPLQEFLILCFLAIPFRKPLPNLWDPN